MALKEKVISYIDKESSRLIEEPNLLAQVKAEHKLNLNGRTYHSPNPKVYAGWE